MIHFHRAFSWRHTLILRCSIAKLCTERSFCCHSILTCTWDVVPGDLECVCASLSRCVLGGQVWLFWQVQFNLLLVFRLQKLGRPWPVCFSKLQYCVNFLLGKDVIFGGRCNCECTVSVCACACVCASVCVCLCVERGLKRLKTSRSVSAWHLTSFSISMMAVTFTFFLFEHRRGIRECLFGIIMGVSPTPLPSAPQNCETQRSLTHHIFTYIY